MANPWYATKGYNKVGIHGQAAVTHDIRYQDDGMTKEAERWRLVFIHEEQKHAVTASDGDQLAQKVHERIGELGVQDPQTLQDIGECFAWAQAHPEIVFYHPHQNPQDIYRVFEATVLDDPIQRAKLADMVRKDVTGIVHDNQYGVQSTWHLDLRDGPNVVWGCDVGPCKRETWPDEKYPGSNVPLRTRDYPVFEDGLSGFLSVGKETWIFELDVYFARWGRGAAFQTVEHIQAFAERRAPSLQRDPAKEPNRTPEPEYEPGD